MRRAVLTGVGQTSAAVSKKHSGCAYMELTAHSGARPDHARWQGQLVIIDGERTKKVIDGLKVFMLKEIGYGDGAGFKGWNCRHNWHPYYLGLSTPNYTQDKIQELNAKKVPYNGKVYSEYEVSQMQRAGERKVRALKRRTVAAQEAVRAAPDDDTRAVLLESDYTTAAVKLKGAEKQLKDFCQQTGRRNDTFRTQVNGFGRSEAQRAVQAAKKEVDKYSRIRYNEDGTIVVTDDWKSKGKVSVPRKYKPNAVVETITTYKDGRKQIDRTIYDANGMMKTQIHSRNHNKPKAHPFGRNGEYHHYYTWIEGEEHPIRMTDDLTDAERKEHSDIL